MEIPAATPTNTDNEAKPVMTKRNTNRSCQRQEDDELVDDDCCWLPAAVGGDAPDVSTTMCCFGPPWSPFFTLPFAVGFGIIMPAPLCSFFFFLLVNDNVVQLVLLLPVGEPGGTRLSSLFVLGNEEKDRSSVAAAG